LLDQAASGERLRTNGDSRVLVVDDHVENTWKRRPVADKILLTGEMTSCPARSL
jgi:hypothetical protein